MVRIKGGVRAVLEWTVPIIVGDEVGVCKRGSVVTVVGDEAGGWKRLAPPAGKTIRAEAGGGAAECKQTGRHVTSQGGR